VRSASFAHCTSTLQAAAFTLARKSRFAGTSLKTGTYPFAGLANSKRLAYERRPGPQSFVDRRLGGCPPHFEAIVEGRLARSTLLHCGKCRRRLFALQISRPDAVVLDLNLPDLPGVEILKRIKGFGSALCCHYSYQLRYAGNARGMSASRG